MKKLGLLSVVVASLCVACTAKRQATENEDQLSGIWQLDYISGPKITFDGLYPNKKPFLKIEADSNRVTGNTSCNRIFSQLNRTGHSISFKDGLGMTKMACLVRAKVSS